ncbi:MAG TPA: branched-chain amino acid ABC transporter permease [Flexilinea sp.]|jgi:branched-chain amino acid transport system permease protein|nr:branched-chain amino acid ABC transporter permease [Flexilinea sp.]HPJ65389.1 branched-chain amino acid ABC transporter permease [Flexilinea sp.]HPR71461.1 branched-chain amino acid ABC transporter permease [Flexilinea sp.]
MVKTMKWLKRNSEVIIIPFIYILIAGLQRAGILNNYIIQVIMLGGINIIMTESLNLVNGLTGQNSIGHAGFMAVGAYVSALFSKVIFNAGGLPPTSQTLVFLLATLMGGIAAAIFGYLIGTPTLRLKGDYLAIVTLGFGEVIRSIIRITPPVGAARGMTGIPKLANLFWVYLFVILAIYVCRNFMDSSYGRACMAIRDNEIAADTMGINTAKYKIIAFVTSAFLAGVAGSMYAHTLRYLHPDVFGYTKSTDFLVYLYAGGVGSISGSILGAFTLTALPEVLRFMKEWRLVIYGGLLVVIILFRPVGMFGGNEFSFLKLKTGGIKSVGFSDLFKRKRHQELSNKEGIQ